MKRGKETTLWLLALLAAAAAVRLIGVTRPLVGNFATKNAVYGMIARNWARGETSATRPALDVLIGGDRSLHLLEIPLSAYLAGGLWSMLGGSLDVWGRLTTIAFSVASVGLMFLLVRRWHSAAAAWVASLVLAFSPVSVIYGQCFMLEASVVFYSLATLLCWSRWLDLRSVGWLALATLSFAALLLTKVYMLALALPLIVMVFWPPRGEEADATGHNLGARAGRRTWALAILAIAVALAPTALWYWQVFQISAPGHPLSARLYYSVRQSAAAHPFPHPILRSGEFYQRALDNLAGVALTPIAFGLALLGFTQREWKRHAPWLLSMAALALALPLKFHEMDYYYLVILPPLCVMAGLGGQLIYVSAKPSRLATAAGLGVFLLFAARYFIKPAFVTPADDRAVAPAAAIVRSLTPSDEPVATLHGTTLDLLYYCDRRGWALSVNSRRLLNTLQDCRRQGARFLVVAGLESLPNHTRKALGELSIVRQGDDFAVYQLP